MSKKFKPEERLWMVIGSSIYTEDTEELKINQSQKTIMVRRAITFNVGETVAQHIVETHNARVKWEQENPVRYYRDGARIK